MTLRDALAESNNAAAADPAAAGRERAPSCSSPQDAGLAICPMCRRSRSAPASSRRST